MGLVSESIDKYTPYEVSIELKNKMFDFLHEKLQVENDSKTRQMILKKMIGFAVSDERITKLEPIFNLYCNDDTGLLGVTDLWFIVYRLNCCKSID